MARPNAQVLSLQILMTNGADALLLRRLRGHSPERIRLARLIHPNWEKKRWMWRKSAIRFMVLFARPNHGSIEERHTHHERRYSSSLRSSIGCTQEIERRV